MAALVLQAGQTLAGYRLISELGRGGFGTVWEAFHRDTGRVALKVLQVKLSREQDQVIFSRFVAEVTTVRRIQHPNVVRVLDAGRGVDATGTALGFYAMELLSGGTLAQVVASQGPLSVAQAARALQDAAAGIHAAHLQGVVHRDVKPENLLFGGDGRVVVVDFGICQFAADQDLTKTGELVGTIRYMAPEHLMEGVTDLRADVFALGAVLFFALTGEHLRPQRDIAGLFRAAFNGEDLRRVEESALSEQVKMLLKDVLAVDPAHRIPTALALAEALGPLVKGPATPALLPPASPAVTTSSSGTINVVGELVDLTLQSVSPCTTCGSVFGSDEELAAHAPYCGAPTRVARAVPPEAFLPPAADMAPLELAVERTSVATFRCDFCGAVHTGESALAAHLERCEMRSWHDRNFAQQPHLIQPMETVQEPQAFTEDPPATGLHVLLGKVKGWLGKPPAAPKVDEMQLLRDQLLTLQDRDAARLGKKGLELVVQMAEMLDRGVGDAELTDHLRPRMAEAARKLVQLCVALQFGRQFLQQFPPLQVERELAALEQRGAQREIVVAKQGLLNDSRSVQQVLAQHQERLQGIVDGLGRSAARLQLSLVGGSPEENRRLEAMVVGLIGDMDAMGSAVREIRRLGLD